MAVRVVVIHTDEPLLKAIAKLKAKHGNGRTAQFLEVSGPTLILILKRRRPIPKQVAWHLGYERVARYKRAGKLYTLEEVHEDVRERVLIYGHHYLADMLGVSATTLHTLKRGTSGLRQQGAKLLGYEKLWRYQPL